MHPIGPLGPWLVKISWHTQPNRQKEYGPINGGSERACERRRKVKSKVWKSRTDSKGESDLSAFCLEPIEDRLICRIIESAIDSRLLVVFKSGTESLNAIIEGVTKRLVDAFQSITTGHENLWYNISLCLAYSDSSLLTLSKAVEQDLGCVATKIGLYDIYAVSVVKNLIMVSGSAAGRQWTSPSGEYGYEACIVSLLCSRVISEHSK